MTTSKAVERVEARGVGAGLRLAAAVLAAGAMGAAASAGGGAELAPTELVHHLIRPDGGCEGPAAAEAPALEELVRGAGERATITLERGAGRGSGLNIELLLSPAVAADAAFVAGLERAAQVWEGAISTPVTVVMAVDFTVGAGFIAAASSRIVTDDYLVVRSRLVSSASGDEAALVAALPPEMLLMETAMGQATALGGVRMTTATAKALGYTVNLPSNGPFDSSIVFNTSFTFDTDPSDGVTPGTVDLVFVMVHELGHALGFISSVDGGGFGLSVSPSVLDLYRFGIGTALNNPATVGDFGTFPRELRSGVEAALDSVEQIPWADTAYRFSTGTSGDGRQASHWKDDALLGLPQVIGVMDPTYNTMQNPQGFITSADLLAFDLVGWSIMRGCPADINGDGFVGSSDLALIFGQWDTAGIADINGDGVVNARDLARVLGAWGVCP